LTCMISNVSGVNNGSTTLALTICIVSMAYILMKQEWK
jgi:hypothetical protein